MILTPDQPVLGELGFKPYRSNVERRFTRFMPDLGQPQEINVVELNEHTD